MCKKCLNCEILNHICYLYICYLYICLKKVRDCLWQTLNNKQHFLCFLSHNFDSFFPHISEFISRKSDYFVLKSLKHEIQMLNTLFIFYSVGEIIFHNYLFHILM